MKVVLHACADRRPKKKIIPFQIHRSGMKNVAENRYIFLNVSPHRPKRPQRAKILNPRSERAKRRRTRVTFHLSRGRPRAQWNQGRSSKGRSLSRFKSCPREVLRSPWIEFIGASTQTVVRRRFHSTNISIHHPCLNAGNAHDTSTGR